MMIYFYLLPKSFPITGTLANGFELWLVDVVFLLLLLADVDVEFVEFAPPVLMSFPITGTLANGFELELCADAFCPNWIVTAENDAIRRAIMATAGSSVILRWSIIE